ncbi:MAG TPA: hypothetical protein VF476_03025 [Chitinophagaceae bacterium]
MQKKILLLFISFSALLCCQAQNPFELGAEYMRPLGRGYNNSIAGVRGETFRSKSSFSIGLTYHFSSSKSYSISKGFGMYAGYRYSFNDNADGKSPFLGARMLFSFENFEGKTILNSLLFTPIAELGYHFMFGDHIYTAPAFGFGYTIKVTREYNSLDEDVGKRFIPMISAGYRF